MEVVQADLSNVKAVILEAARAIAVLKEQRKALNAQINEHRAKVKGLGIKAEDFNIAIRLAELPDEEQSESIKAIRTCFEALRPGQQGTLFAGFGDEGGGASDETEDDAFAEVVGPDSAKAARGHRYPRNRFSGDGQEFGPAA